MADVLRCEDRIQRRAVKRAVAVFVDNEIFWSRRHFVDQFRIPRTSSAHLRFHSARQDFLHNHPCITVVVAPHESREDNRNRVRARCCNEIYTRCNRGLTLGDIKSREIRRSSFAAKPVLHIDNNEGSAMNGGQI